MLSRGQVVENTDLGSGFKEKALEVLGRLEYRRILGGEDLEDVFRLRYEAYIRGGLIEKSTSRKSTDYYDTTPNCMIFGLYYDGELASSIRVHHASQDIPYCPTKSHFPGVLEPYLEAGVRFVDASRFCADLRLSQQIPNLPLFTTRLSAMACVYHEAHYMLSVIRPEHSAFYRRYFNMKLWSKNQKVDWFAFPVDLYAADVETCRHGVLQRLPFFRSLPQERELLFGDREANSVHVRPTAHSAIKAAQNVTDFGQMDSK